MKCTLVPLAVAPLLLAACGGTPPAKDPTPQTEPTQRPVSSGIRVSSELGQIDEAGVKRTFQGLDDAFDRCEDEGQKRIEVLSGRVKFFVRVGEGGVPKYGFLSESTVGDHETEQCLLRAVLHARFPKPDGGEAEVTYATSLRPSGGRPASEWTADRVPEAVAAAASCKGGASGDFSVTLYVVEGSGKAGKVEAAGASASSKEASDKIDCIVRALKDAKVPSPGSWPAKVTFKL